MLKSTGLAIVILIAISALLWPGEPVIGENVLSGQDILNALNSNVGLGECVIEASRILPGKLSEDTGLPIYDGYASYESIYIFSDGQVYSTRDYSQEIVMEYERKNYHFDGTWENINLTGRQRQGKYTLSQNQLLQLLSYIGDYKQELLPGDRVLDYHFRANLRIIYDGKEGELSEPIGLGIESKENLSFINTFIDKVLEMEGQAEVTSIPETFMAELKAEKEKFNWTENSSLQGTMYYNIEDAWRAHGLIK